MPLVILYLRLHNFGRIALSVKWARMADIFTKVFQPRFPLQQKENIAENQQNSQFYSSNTKSFRFLDNPVLPLKMDNVSLFIFADQKYEEAVQKSSHAHLLADKDTFMEGAYIKEILEGACKNGLLQIPQAKIPETYLPTAPKMAEPTTPPAEKERPIYPILSPDGQPLPTDETGRHLDANGIPISTNDEGVPVDSEGNVLKKDAKGNFIYPAKLPETYLPELGERQTTEASTTVVKPSCDAPGNIVFVLESSDKVKAYWDDMKEQTLTFIVNNIDADAAKVGVLAYGYTVQIPVDVGSYANVRELVDLVSGTSLIGGNTDGDVHAIRTAKQILHEKSGEGLGQVIVLVYETPLRLVRCGIYNATMPKQ